MNNHIKHLLESIFNDDIFNDEHNTLDDLKVNEHINEKPVLSHYTLFGKNEYIGICFLRKYDDNTYNLHIEYPYNIKYGYISLPEDEYVLESSDFSIEPATKSDYSLWRYAKGKDSSIRRKCKTNKDILNMEWIKRWYDDTNFKLVTKYPAHSICESIFNDDIFNADENILSDLKVYDHLLSDEEEFAQTIAVKYKNYKIDNINVNKHIVNIDFYNIKNKLLRLLIIFETQDRITIKQQRLNLDRLWMDDNYFHPLLGHTVNDCLLWIDIYLNKYACKDTEK